MVYKYDVLLFHEGDVLPHHQQYVLTGHLDDNGTVVTPTGPHDNRTYANVRFVDLSKASTEAFRTPTWVPTNFTLPEGYGLSYLHMCRFFAKLLFPMLWDDYDVVMRFDEDVQMAHAVRYDLLHNTFVNNYTYVYGADVPEWHEETAATFGPWVRKHLESRSDYYAPHIARNISDEAVDRLGGSMYFTNFFVTRLDWWKQPHVQSFLGAVDRSGNIYCKRWGDAPIQSSALRLFADVCDVVPLCRISYFHGSTGHVVRNCLVMAGDSSSLQGLAAESTDITPEQREKILPLLKSLGLTEASLYHTLQTALPAASIGLGEVRYGQRFAPGLGSRQ